MLTTVRMRCPQRLKRCRRIELDKETIINPSVSENVSCLDIDRSSDVTGSPRTDVDAARSVEDMGRA